MPVMLSETVTADAVTGALSTAMTTKFNILDGLRIFNALKLSILLRSE